MRTTLVRLPLTIQRSVCDLCATFVDLRDSPDFQTLNIAWSPLIYSIVVNIVWKVCSNNLTTDT